MKSKKLQAFVKVSERGSSNHDHREHTSSAPLALVSPSPFPSSQSPLTQCKRRSSPGLGNPASLHRAVPFKKDSWTTVLLRSSAPLLSTAPLCEALTDLRRNPSCGELRLASRGLGVPLGGCIVNAPFRTTPRRQGILCRISPNFL